MENTMFNFKKRLSIALDNLISKTYYLSSKLFIISKISSAKKSELYNE